MQKARTGLEHGVLVLAASSKDHSSCRRRKEDVNRADRGGG